MTRTEQSNINDRLRRLINYLEKFKMAVAYGKFRNNGWPMGSGEVESTHRYIPQEQMKISDANWHPNTVNPMLKSKSFSGQ